MGEWLEDVTDELSEQGWSHTSEETSDSDGDGSEDTKNLITELMKLVNEPPMTIGVLQSEEEYDPESNSFGKRTVFDTVRATLTTSSGTIQLPDVEWVVVGHKPTVYIKVAARFAYKDSTNEGYKGYICYKELFSESVLNFFETLRSGTWSCMSLYSVSNTEKDSLKSTSGVGTLTLTFSPEAGKKILEGLLKYLEEVTFVFPSQLCKEESHEE